MANSRNTPNSQEIPIEVVGSSSFGRYSKISVSKTYNMFESDGWLVNTAGYKKVAQILGEEIGAGRGLFNSVRGGFAIAVFNAAVYRISANYTAIFLGNLNTTSGEVFIDENLSSQICIVDGVNAWIYYYGGPPTLHVQSLSGSLIPRYVTYHNTFFLFGNGDTTSSGAKWYAYSRASDTTISQNTELALETKPDYAIAIERIPGQSNNVLVFGTTVCEVWTQVGGTQNYRRNSTLSIDYGCLSTSTIDSSDQYVAWLAVNEFNAPVIMVYSGQGYSAISSDGIDYQLQQLVRPDKSTAMIYRLDGHLFYQITFFDERDNISLLYDFNTQKFFNLCDWDSNYHPARQTIYFNKKQLFVSLKNTALYEQSTDITVYNNNLNGNDETLINDIPRTRICNFVRAEDNSKYRINSFKMTIEQGNDPNSTQLAIDNACGDSLITEVTEDDIISEYGNLVVTESSSITNSCIPYRPRVDLCFSKDGGHSWSNTVGRELNPVGKRQNMLQWENMGAANEFVIKLKFWGMSRFVVNNGYVEVF